MGTLRKKMIFILTSAIVGVLCLLVSYFILIQTGVIQARQSKLVIVADSFEKVYDGEELTCSSYKITYGSIRPDHKIEATFYGSQVDAGTSNCSVVCYITDADGVDVTNKYDIEYVPGTLFVAQRYIKIKSGSDEKYYDGEPLKGGKNGFSIMVGSLVAGHTIDVEGVSEITKVGVTDNVISAKISNGDGVDVTANYDVNYGYGTLTVLSNEIKIKSATLEKEYDGLPLYASDGYDENGNPPYIISEGSDMLKAFNHKLIVETTGEITNVGSVPHEIKATIVDKSGDDVSNLYNVELEVGELKIIPREMTVFSPGAEKTYDGLPLKKADFAIGDEKAVPERLVSGHNVVATYSGSQTDVGQSPNNFSGCDVFDSNNNLVTANYKITYQPGILTVNPILISVYSPSATKNYDGTPLVCHETPIITGGLLLGHEPSFEFLSSITYPGTVENDVVCRITDEYNHDVSGFYNITYHDGNLNVTAEKKVILVKTPSLSVIYDDTDHKTDQSLIELIDDSKLSEGHFINYLGDTPTFKNVAGYSSSGEVLGYENQIIENSWQILDGSGNDVSNEYMVVATMQNLGTVKILPMQINVYSESFTKTYDGSPFDATEVSNGLILLESQPYLLSGHQIYGYKSVIPTQILAGTYVNDVSVSVLDGNGNDVSINYVANPFYLGTLTIKKAVLNVTIDFASKTNNDGLTDDGLLTVEHDEYFISGVVSSGDSYDTVSSIKFTSISQADVSNGIDNAKVEVVELIIYNSANNLNVASCYEIVITDAYLYWI